MKLEIKTILLFCIVLTFSSEITAQQVFSSATGNASGLEGNLSYTIGQIFSNVYTNENGYKISEGIHQVFQISTASAKDLISNQNYNLKLFPNPVSHWVIIESLSDLNQNLQYQIIDTQGRIFKNNKITSRITKIDLHKLKSGTYFLRILNSPEVKTSPFVKTQQSTEALKTFQIIKK